MEYIKSKTYCEDIETSVRHIKGFESFYGKKVLVLGASGLIGSFVTDCFLWANKRLKANITVYAVSRSAERLRERFQGRCEDGLHLTETDVTELNLNEPFDYIIHGAGYGHPKAFREMPAEVLWTNVVGTGRVLELAKVKKGCRMLYISSGEVQEQVDHLSARACYPMGKRTAETLCIAYGTEYGVESVIARPCHTFGANVLKNDNRAATQFILAAAQGMDIEMYSTGKQVRSFAYVADCVSGLLTALVNGKHGVAYGISSGESCSVKMFADKCALEGKCKVKMHRPDDAERRETSPILQQIVNNDALKELGWRPVYSIDDGIKRTVRIIHEIDEG